MKYLLVLISFAASIFISAPFSCYKTGHCSRIFFNLSNTLKYLYAICFGCNYSWFCWTRREECWKTCFNQITGKCFNSGRIPQFVMDGYRDCGTCWSINNPLTFSAKMVNIKIFHKESWSFFFLHKTGSILMWRVLRWLLSRWLCMISACICRK